MDVASGAVRDAFTHPRNPEGKSIPRECGDVVFLQNTTPDVLLSSQSLWAPDPTRRTTTTSLDGT